MEEKQDKSLLFEEKITEGKLPDAELDAFAADSILKLGNSIGYPMNQAVPELKNFYDWFFKSGLCGDLLNNVSGPYSYSPIINSKKFESRVINYFAPLYGFDLDNMWGFICASGTDANNHGIYFGRKYLASKVPNAPVIAYVSKESHYSNARICDLQNLEVKILDTDKFGRMSPEALREALDPSRPALMIYSMGSTFLGAIDDQETLNKVIEEVNPPAVYRHVDAALFGGYLPFTEHKDLVNAQKLHFDSIAVSGHKFFGVNMPCGIFITTQDVVSKQTAFTPKYLNGNMFMISCSRSAVAPLILYWLIKNVGEEGFRKDAEAMLQNTAYLKSELDRIGWPAWVNDYSNTVFMRRPPKEIVEKYVLAGGYEEEYGGELSHVVVMPHVTREIIDRFIEDMKAVSAKFSL